MLVFDGVTDALQIGANLTTDDGAPLQPGGAYGVQLTFWDPEVEDALAHRETFDLWAGRTVGSGRLAPDRP